jgi:outer membrane lipoprotein LolB
VSQAAVLLPIRQSAFATLALVALSHCQVAPPKPPAPLPDDPARLVRWQASGRIAVSGPEGGGSASFNWVQTGEQSQVAVRGPAGIGSVRLQIAGDTLDIETSAGHFTAQEAESELAMRLGAPLPTQQLRYWMVGIAAPGEHRWEQQQDSRTLFQQTWRIDYQRYALTSGVELPARWVAQSGPAKVRIVVDKWQLNNE